MGLILGKSGFQVDRSLFRPTRQTSQSESRRKWWRPLTLIFSSDYNDFFYNPHGPIPLSCTPAYYSCSVVANTTSLCQLSNCSSQDWQPSLSSALYNFFGTARVAFYGKIFKVSNNRGPIGSDNRRDLYNKSICVSICLYACVWVLFWNFWIGKFETYS